MQNQAGKQVTLRKVFRGRTQWRRRSQQVPCGWHGLGSQPLGFSPHELRCYHNRQTSWLPPYPKGRRTRQSGGSRPQKTPGPLQSQSPGRMPLTELREAEDRSTRRRLGILVAAGGQPILVLQSRSHEAEQVPSLGLQFHLWHEDSDNSLHLLGWELMGRVNPRAKHGQHITQQASTSWKHKWSGLRASDQRQSGKSGMHFHTCSKVSWVPLYRVSVQTMLKSENSPLKLSLLGLKWKQVVPRRQDSEFGILCRPGHSTGNEMTGGGFEHVCDRIRCNS